MRKRFTRPKSDIGLLPYIREDVHGFDPSSTQRYGWELEKFNIPSYWSKSNGTGVRIAVIDTGCDLEHEDLKDNIIEGHNFVNKQEPPIDRNGHGSHIAGTIAAKNNGKGIAGVAPNAQIMPVKALNDDGSGELLNIVNAIIWSVDNGADFITMSLGSPTPNKKLENALKYAHSKGVICFCAAGNSGSNYDIMYPAKYDNAISIGAIDKNFNRTDFTCSGESLDFLAPGLDIMSCIPGNRYALMSGTSMSNPFAVACAALLCSWNRINKKYTLSSINDYIEVFKQKAISLSCPEYQNKKYQGYGIINLKGII
jgi:subtilisin family serine protease